MMRTHYCGTLTESQIDQTVTLCGWVHRRRDHGGVIFLDMRDRDGLVQVVIDPDTPEAFSTADKARSEFVLKITGRVRRRYEGTENANMVSGQIEVLAKDIEVLAASETPPFPLNDENTNISEEVRLKYRFLDIRRPEMLDRLRFRSKLTNLIRNYFEENGFLDVETPILTRATPEGARDYLVPSRVSNGSFYALPQSPQLFKQLLMVGGIDRYYQIAKCFRDEDLRADRQPEFTQIDVETSFMSDDDIMDLMEVLTIKMFKELLNVDFGKFQRMTYADAMEAGYVEPSHASGYHYFSNSWGQGTVSEDWVTELNYIALREISFGYSVPQALANKLGAKSMNLALSARNLGYLYNTMPNNVNPEGVRGNDATEFRERSFSPYTANYMFTINVGF